MRNIWQQQHYQIYRNSCVCVIWYKNMLQCARVIPYQLKWITHMHTFDQRSSFFRFFSIMLTRKSLYAHVCLIAHNGWICCFHCHSFNGMVSSPILLSIDVVVAACICTYSVFSFILSLRVVAVVRRLVVFLFYYISECGDRPLLFTLRPI